MLTDNKSSNTFKHGLSKAKIAVFVQLFLLRSGSASTAHSNIQETYSEVSLSYRQPPVTRINVEYDAQHADISDSFARWRHTKWRCCSRWCWQPELWSAKIVRILCLGTKSICCSRKSSKLVHVALHSNCIHWQEMRSVNITRSYKFLWSNESQEVHFNADNRKSVSSRLWNMEKHTKSWWHTESSAAIVRLYSHRVISNNCCNDNSGRTNCCNDNYGRANCCNDNCDRADMNPDNQKDIMSTISKRSRKVI